MTTLFTCLSQCPVCGEMFGHMEIGSTNTFGSMNLDTRPPEMARSTMSHWLSECPECGYVSDDMKRPAPIDRAFLETKEYKTCGGYDFKNSLSKGFYRRYLIVNYPPPRSPAS